MSEHELSIGLSSDWLTPPKIFAGLKRGGIDRFDLDVAHPPASDLCFVPCDKFYTLEDDGLKQPWQIHKDRRTLVWGNFPFGGRRGQVPWLRLFFKHYYGIALVAARTSADWFCEVVAPNAQILLFPYGKVKFHRPDGTIGKEPGTGVVLIGAGDRACSALVKSGLGWCAPIIEAGRGLRFPWLPADTPFPNDDELILPPQVRGQDGFRVSPRERPSDRQGSLEFGQKRRAP